MPSFLIEYTRNVEEDCDIGELVRVIHEAAHSSGLFQRAGMRTRAVPIDHYRISTGEAENGFVQIVAKLKAGREPADQQQLAETILTAAQSVLRSVYARRPFAVYVEVMNVAPISINHRTNG